MAPPNATKAAPAVAESDPRKSDRRGGTINSTLSEAAPKAQHLLTELAAARQHLERRGEANIVIGEWRDELRRRIARTNLKAELIGITAEEHDAIVAEVDKFKRLCRALGWSMAARRRS